MLNATTVLVNDYGTPMPIAVLTYGTTADPTATFPGVARITDAGGSVTLQANGSFTYTPPAGFSGTDQFKYITGNGNLPNNDATVSITVAGDITIAIVKSDPLCNGAATGTITVNASGGNSTLTYSKNGMGGPYQASNTFTGLPAGIYTIAVKDAGGYIKTATVTLNDPALLTVSGTVPTLTYSNPMSTVTFTTTGGTGIVTWAAAGLPPGLTLSTTTGALTGTPTQTGSFTAVVVTATDANGCIDTHPLTINIAPKLAADSYAVVGNTQLVSDGHSTPLTPHTTSATNMLGNDAADVTLVVTAVTDVATTGGGRITINSAGKFIYSPPAGNTLADTYTYTASASGVSATATITLTPSGMIWYVNNTYAGVNGTSNGTSHRPFTDASLAATASSVNQIIYVHTGTGTTPGAIVLKSGQTLRGAGAALTLGALSLPVAIKPVLGGTVTLANSVIVDGLDMSTGASTAITASTATAVSVSVGSVTTSGAPGAVSLTNTTGTVTIAGGTQTNSTVAAFTITGGTVSLTYNGNITQSTNALMVSVSNGHSAGTITFQAGTLNATAGNGVNFDNADGVYNFNGTTIFNGGDAGIDIVNNSGGTFSFNANTSIINPGGIAINMNASNANITYAGSFNKTSANSGISITNNTGGTVTINGAGTKILSTSTSNAINITANTGTTVNLSGNNLLLTTTTGTAFNATGGGTISVTGTGNIINASSGMGVNINLTTIGASGVTFQSVSSGNNTAAADPAKGISVVSSGSGFFSVTGVDGADADVLADAGTGGTITNTSQRGAEFITVAGAVSLNGMNFTNATTSQSVPSCAANIATTDILSCNAPIFLASLTGSISLRSISVDGSVQGGIYGTDVTNLTMNTVEVKNAGNEVDESGIIFRNLKGTGSITGLNSHDNAARQFYIHNNGGSVLSSFSISNSTFANASVLNGIQGILLETNNTATLNVAVSSCTFSNIFSNAYQVAGNGSSFLTVSLTNSIINNANAWGVVQASMGANINATISGCSGTSGVNTQSGFFAIKTDNGSNTLPTSIVNVMISGNTVGDAVTPGCTGCNGIFANSRHGTTINMNVIGNTFRHINGSAVYVSDGEDANGRTGKFNTVITGNLMKDPDVASAPAVQIRSGVTSGPPADAGCVTATIGGTVNPGTWPSQTANAMNRIEGDWNLSSGVEIFLFRRFNTTLNIPAYDGSGIDAWMKARNSMTSPGINASAVSIISGGATCL